MLLSGGKDDCAIDDKIQMASSQTCTCETVRGFPAFGALAGGPAARDADTGQLCTPPAGLLRKDGLKVRAVLLSLYLRVSH